MEDIKVEILTKEKFDENPEFYQNSFDEIEKSQGYDPTDNYEHFFNYHLINSITVLMVNNKIVSYAIAIPISSDLIRWSLSFIATHKNYEGKNYAKKVLMVCIKDILKKGCKKIESYPVSGHSLLEKVANELPFTKFSGYQQGFACLEMQEEADIIEEDIQRK